jgi:hypothetical protein
MLLLQPKDGISAQSRDVAEDESGQSYETWALKPGTGKVADMDVLGMFKLCWPLPRESVGSAQIRWESCNECAKTLYSDDGLSTCQL